MENVSLPPITITRSVECDQIRFTFTDPRGVKHGFAIAADRKMSGRNRTILMEDFYHKMMIAIEYGWFSPDYDGRTVECMYCGNRHALNPGWSPHLHACDCIQKQIPLYDDRKEPVQN